MKGIEKHSILSLLSTDGPKDPNSLRTSENSADFHIVSNYVT